MPCSGTVAAVDRLLPSAREVSGYRLPASDTAMAHLEDCLVKDGWTIGFLVVDTCDCWPEGHEVILPQWIAKLGWAKKESAASSMEI